MEEKISQAEIWRGPIAWMIENNVAANLLMWAMLVGGIICLANTKQEVMPPFDIDVVTISLSLSGATPDEIEKGMVLAVEDAVRAVDGVNSISTTIRSSGSATVSVEAVKGIDRQVFLQDIQGQVDRIRTFPEEASTPTVVLSSLSRGVIVLLVSGSDDILFLREWAENVENELLLKNNISQASLARVPDKEIQIEIPQETLRKYKLTLNNIASAIRLASIEQGAGTLETVDGDISIKISDKKEFATEFAQVSIVSLADGSRVLLEDVATIKETFSDRKSWSEFNGTPAIMININRVGDQTPQLVAADALEVVERMNAIMPAGLRIDVRNNDADMLIDRIGLLTGNALTGIILVFLCLALFLEPKLAMWVSIGIPIAVMGSFMFLEPAGVSINMMSLFAFILTLGIVVDDAIVVGENVHIWRRKGYSRGEAAVLGTREISVPIVFSVLTNMVAFLPLTLLPGMISLLFAPIVPVVTIVFMCSLIESLFVLPCHLAHDTKAKKGSIMFRLNAIQRQFSIGFTKWVERVYGPILDKVLNNKYSVVSACIGFLILSTSYVASGRLGMEFMPKVESDFAYCEIVMPTGTSIEVLQEMANRLYQSAQKVINENGGDALSEGVYINVFGGSTITGQLFLVDADIRPISTNEVTELWKQSAGNFEGIETISFEADRGGPGSGKALTVRLMHRDSETLERAAADLAEFMKEFPNVSDIDTGASKQNVEYQIKLTPLAEKLGLTSNELSSQLYAAFEGVTVLRQQRAGDEITVRLRLPQVERTEISTLDGLVIRTPSNEEVLLRDVVTITEGKAPALIRREEGQRTLNISANVNPRFEAGKILAAIQTDYLPDLISRYPGLSQTQGGQQKDINDSMGALYKGLLLVVLGIYVLLAIPFKSYTQPAIIMIAIPFGIVGAIFGHIVMGYSMSVISVMGILALSGLVVNDSLMLIAFANNEMRRGANAFEAMHMAGVRRFRPILLTTLTTFIGLLPMLLETSIQARMLIPIVISLGFGILFASVITLALVPSLYLILDDWLPKKKALHS